MINTSPETWSLFPTVRHPNGKTEATSFVPANIWHYIVQYLPPFGAMELRCNLLLRSIIPNSSYWKDSVEQYFPKSTYTQGTPFERFLHNQRIQYNMKREICSKQVISFLDSSVIDLREKFFLMDLNEKYLFVGSNKGVVEWFDRKNGRRIGSINIHVWKNQLMQSSIQSLKEINGILYVQFYYTNERKILYVIDLDSKLIHFDVDCEKYQVVENNLYILSKCNINIYNIKSNELQNRFVSVVKKEEGETISSFSVDQKRNRLYLLYFNSSHAVQIRVFDLKNESTSKTERSENTVDVNLSHLFDLEVGPLDHYTLSEFDGSELYISSDKTIKAWNIDSENKCLSPILNISNWKTTKCLDSISIFSEDYLFTTDSQVHKIWKRNGVFLGRINSNALKEHRNSGYIAAHGACLAIPFSTSIADKKTQYKGREMWDSTSPSYNPIQYTHFSTVEILNFDVDIPEDKFSKALECSKKEIEQLGAICEKTFEEATKQVEEKCSIQ